MPRALVVLLLAIVALLAPGCGSKPAAIPIGASNPAIATILGAPSNVAIVVRPRAIFADPYWGGAMQRAMAKPSASKDDPDAVPALNGPILGAQQVEIFAAVRDAARVSSAPKESIGAESIGYVLVVRGMPGATTMDPSRLVSRRGERVWLPPIRLPSGVWEFAPSPSYAQRQRGLAPVLFVLPDGTWVAVDQPTGARAHGVFSSESRPPPMPTFDGDGLLAIVAEGPIVEAAARRSEVRSDTLVRGLVGAGLVLYGGRDGAIELLLDYRLDGDADRAASYVSSGLLEVCGRGDLGCALLKLVIRDVKVKTDDRRVSLRFFLSDLVLAKIASGD